MAETLCDLEALIIGAGYAGLAAAIELAKRGANVQVFESLPDLGNQGDVIMMPANATRIFSKWGTVLEDLEDIAGFVPEMDIQTKTGKLLYSQQLPQEFGGYPELFTNRGRLQHLMYDYAVSLGVKVRFNSRVTDVSETDKLVTVKLGEEIFQGDVLIASDGVRSKGRKAVTGVLDQPLKSGFAVYRTWFPLSALENDPIAAKVLEWKSDVFKVWIDEDIHIILVTNNNLKFAACFVTHKDDADIEESWSLPGTVGDMLKCVEGWDPLVRHFIKCIPADRIIDHKLLWRDPVHNWVSPKGRVALAGDSAHPHLASSAQGAAQAIESGTTIAACLERGKNDVTLALRVYSRMRFERTSITQRMGWETRHIWHQTDWESISRNPEILAPPMDDWLHDFDAEKYALDNFGAVASHLTHGTPFTSTNVPKGHVHEPWTIKVMLGLEGQKLDMSFYKTRAKNSAF